MTIGANAVVRGCVLRDGARVEELAVVEGLFYRREQWYSDKGW